MASGNSCDPARSAGDPGNKEEILPYSLSSRGESASSHSLMEKLHSLSCSIDVGLRLPSSPHLCSKCSLFVKNFIVRNKNK
jgi:hypothetical protein